MFNLTDLTNLDLKDEIPDTSSLRTTNIPNHYSFYEDTSFKPSLILGKFLSSESDIIKNNPASNNIDNYLFIFFLISLNIKFNNLIS